LSIQHLSEIDEGDYICSVQNVHGSDQVIYWDTKVTNNIKIINECLLDFYLKLFAIYYLAI
jgi:hypothetical protein